IVTTVAPTIPVDAAIIAPTTVTERPSPPRSRPNSKLIVSSSSSARRDRSSMTPMNTNSGTATSTSFVIVPKMRCGSADRKASSKTPRAIPRTAKISATPPSVKATGEPQSSAPQTATTIRRSRTSVMRAAIPGRSRYGRSVRRSQAFPHRLRHPFSPGEDKNRSEREGETLGEHQHRADEDHRLEKVDPRDATGFSRTLANRPCRADIRPGDIEDQDAERPKQQKHAPQIDPGFRSLARSAVEHVDPDVGITHQGIAGTQHEQEAMHVDDRLLELHEAEAEHVTKQHHEELRQHHGQRDPGHHAADAVVDAVDAPGNMTNCRHANPALARSGRRGVWPNDRRVYRLAPHRPALELNTAAERRELEHEREPTDGYRSLRLRRLRHAVRLHVSDGAPARTDRREGRPVVRALAAEAARIFLAADADGPPHRFLARDRRRPGSCDEDGRHRRPRTSGRADAGLSQPRRLSRRERHDRSGKR